MSLSKTNTETATTKDTSYRCSKCGITIASTKRWGLLPELADVVASPSCTEVTGHIWYETRDAVVVASATRNTTPVVGVWDNPSKFK